MNIVITGAARRIGRELALKLTTDQDRLALHYNNSEQEILSLSHELTDKHIVHKYYKRDFTDPCGADNLISEIRSDFGGPIDLILNCASIYEKQQFIDISKSDMQKQLNIHFLSPFVLISDMFRQQTGGIIINFIDAQVSQFQTGMAPYLLSKRLLSDLTRIAAKESPPGFRINGISPGYILDPVNNPGFNRSALMDKSPLKIKGEVNDLYKTIQFIISNPYIHGQIIGIDGGMYI